MLWFLDGLLLFALDLLTGCICLRFLFLWLVWPRFCLWLVIGFLDDSNLLEDLLFSLDLLSDEEMVLPLLDGFVLDLHEWFLTFDKPVGVGILGLFLLAIKGLLWLLNVM